MVLINPSIISSCRLCPRECGIDRTKGEKGFCHAGYQLRVARIALHHWEEPPVSGTHGSGTVFFSGCSLGCVFCQNHSISHEFRGKDITPLELAERFIGLQDAGAHNINLVTAAHYIPMLIETIQIARSSGLTIPIIYNSSGYEKIETLKMLIGLVDVYLPDLKYVSDELSRRYSNAADYFSVASLAIQEMVRQCGPVQLDESGLIRAGVIVRHLILPGAVQDSKACLQWAKANLPKGVFLSLMAQYYPIPGLSLPTDLKRKITAAEYDSVLNELFRLGLEEGFVQELDSADARFIPAFDFTGV